VIRIRSQADALAMGMSVLALLVVVCTGLYALLVKAPAIPTNARTRLEARDKIRQEAQDARIRAQQVSAQVAGSTWAVPSDQVAAQSLAKITGFAKARNITVVAFRPQKTVEVEGLTQLPFLILVDGKFPEVMQFMKDIERTDTKLAVSLVQMASADEASDRVSATIGAAAYLQPQKKGATVGKNL
jgi:Tfp pilus assembly protein PilO